MRNKIFMAALVVALAWGLEQVVVSPLETGNGLSRIFVAAVRSDGDAWRCMRASVKL